MKLTKKHIDVANELALGKLTMEKIAVKHGIRNRQTIYDWLAHEEFSDFLDQIERKYKRMALCVAGRWATEAVKRLIVNFADGKSDAEVARKSAMDLLNIAGLKVDKVQGGGFGNNTIVIVRSDGDKTKAKDKTKEFSGRFRL